MRTCPSLILGNYTIGEIVRVSNQRKKFYLILGILLNVSILGYFKYTDFFISSVNTAFSTEFPLLKILLPLAISFCTFQQISYLVDIYKGSVKKYGIRNYFLFISFFPQLIAGPIVHHKEMMPQFEAKENMKIKYENILLGVCIFGIGIFKKLAIADNLSIWVDHGFSNAEYLGFWSGWVASLSYTFQLYYDFSGYVDMAIGLALLFNIRLPSNFNSPYKASNIQDFWRGWHMTLSRWMRDYIYIPLGGSRSGHGTTLRNLFLTAFISGIWRGAGLGFVIWGALHGLGMVLHRVWQQLGLKMHKYMGWVLTFLFVNFAWVFFRASSLTEAKHIIKAMLGLQQESCSDFVKCGIYYNQNAYIDTSTFIGRIQSFITQPSHLFALIVLLIVLFLTLRLRNTTDIYSSGSLKSKTVILSAILFGIAFALMHLSSSAVFLYFNF